jgi:hypothetical protein
MLPLLRDRSAFSDDPFVLVDVGCSGGIEGAWREFGENLIAHAFDPVIPECEQLRAVEEFPGVKYHARFVGLPPDHAFMRRKPANERYYHCDLFSGRTSTAYAWTFRVPEDVQICGEHVSAPPANELADESTLVGVADFVREAGLSTVDFIKIDVDGTDFDVLVSTEGILASHQVLGVGIETNWTGTTSETDNTFHNIDRFMRLHGFSLFGVTARSYSRRDLPMPFTLNAVAQTRSGQPVQGDALYLRDLGMRSQKQLAEEYSTSKLLKLACLFEMFRLSDCAAELINVYRARLVSRIDPELLLDTLTPPLNGQRLPYREYIKAFEQNIKLFLATPEEAGLDIEGWRLRYAKDVQALSDKIAALQNVLARSSEAAEVLREETADLRTRLDGANSDYRAALQHMHTLQSSRSWRLAARLQAIAGLLGLRRTAA